MLGRGDLQLRAGVSGAIVECTTTTVPARAEPRAWPSTSRTWSSSRTITHRMSTRAARPTTDPATLAPAASSSASGSGATS